MRIMFYTIEGFDTPNSNNHMIHRLLKAFLGSGDSIFLIESNRGGSEGNVPVDLACEENFKYVAIKRRFVDKLNFIARYIEGIKFFMHARKQWEQELSTIDVCIVQSTPTAIFPILSLSIRHKKKVIFYIYDVFPNGIFEITGMRKGVIYKMLHIAEKLAYRKCSRIIVLSEDMKDKLIMDGVDTSKIDVIVSWYDDKIISEVSPDDNRFFKKYSIAPRRTYIQYAGNFGYTFDWRMVIAVAEILKERTDIVFHMIGSGTFEDQFKTEASKKQLQNIVFYPWQPLEIIMDVYSAATIALIPLSRNVVGNSHPSKASLLMACGRTFICSGKPGSKLLEEYNSHRVGIGIPDDNPKLIAEAIIEMVNNPKMLHDYEKRAFDYARNELSFEVNIGKFQRSLLKAIAEN